MTNITQWWNPHVSWVMKRVLMPLLIWKRGDEGSIPFVNKGSHKGSIQILRNNWRKHVWWWVSFVSMRKGSITDRWMDILFLKIERTHKEEDYESTYSLFLFRMKEQHACKHKRVFMIIPHIEKKQNKRDANASLQILYCREKWFLSCFCLNNLYITASHNQYSKKYFIIGKEREPFKWNKTGLDRRWKVISQTDIFRRNPAVIEIAAAAANVVAVDD